MDSLEDIQTDMAYTALEEEAERLGIDIAEYTEEADGDEYVLYEELGYAVVAENEKRFKELKKKNEGIDWGNRAVFQESDKGIWTVSFNGKSLTIADKSAGMKYIHHLVKNRGAEFTPDDLFTLAPKRQYSPSRNTQRVASAMTAKDEDGISELNVTNSSTIQKMVSQVDIKKVRNLLRGYEDELEDLLKVEQEQSDPSMIVDIRIKAKEKEVLISKAKEYLNSVSRKNGKPRNFKNQYEQNPNTIFQAIKRARKRLKDCPALLEHLKHNIKRDEGRFRYDPPEEQTWEWEA